MADHVAIGLKSRQVKRIRGNKSDLSLLMSIDDGGLPLPGGCKSAGRDG
jgi:hypothetical protein